MTAIELLKEALHANGYGGLVHIDTECGCHLDDFHICSDAYANCEAAYKHDLPNGDWIMTKSKYPPKSDPLKE